MSLTAKKQDPYQRFLDPESLKNKHFRFNFTLEVLEEFNCPKY